MFDPKSATLVGPIVGALIALAGVIVTMIAGASRERRQFRREKGWALYEDERANIERIYSAFEELRESYSAQFNFALKSLGQKQLVGGKNEVPIPWETLRMLVGLYAPELNDAIQRLEPPTTAFNMILVDMLEAFGTDGKLLPELTSAWQLEMLERITGGLSAINREVDVALEELRTKAAALRKQAGEVAKLN